MITALLLTLALQTPSPPPAMTDESSAGEPAPAPRPSPPRPPSPSLAPSRVVPMADPQQGKDDVTTTLAQLGGGAGACCVASCVGLPLVLVPVVGAVLYNAVIGAAVGGTEAVVGDMVGRKRGTFAVPIVVGAGISLAGFGAATAWDALVPRTAANSVLVGQLGTLDVRVGAGAAIIAVTTVAALVVPALVYQATAVDKEPGDSGSFPGFFVPADPTGTRAADGR